MQIQWACTDIVLPWKDTHNKLSLNTVKETFSSYSGAFEVGLGYSPRGGGECDTLSLGPVIHVASRCSSVHDIVKFENAFPSSLCPVIGLAGHLNWCPHLWCGGICFILCTYMFTYLDAWNMRETTVPGPRHSSFGRTPSCVCRGQKGLVSPAGSHCCSLIVC